MALLNYERILNADRFCLCQLSQQPQLKKLIPTTFSIGGQKKRAVLLAWPNMASPQSAANGLKSKLTLLVKFQQILQFHISTLLLSSGLLAVALPTSSSLLLGGPYFRCKTSGAASSASDKVRCLFLFVQASFMQIKMWLAGLKSQKTIIRLTER